MGRGSHFVAMTTAMSLQLWWWKIFILIQLWSQFFQMFVYGDVVYAQTWYWPWKTVSSHLHMPGRPMLLQYGPHFFSTLSEKFGQLASFFGANGLPPPWQKISRTPMAAQTYMAYIREYNPWGMIQVSLRAFLQFTHCCLASCVTCWSASSFSWRQVMQYTFR